MKLVLYLQLVSAIDFLLAVEVILACLLLRLQLVFPETLFHLLFESVDGAMFYFVDLPACSISLPVVPVDVFAHGASFSG